MLKFQFLDQFSLSKYMACPESLFQENVWMIFGCQENMIFEDH